MRSTVKFYVIVCIVVLLLNVSQCEAIPANGKTNKNKSENTRITCDVASGFGWAHTLCAGLCLLRGYSGGYCDSMAVCICREWR